MNAVELRRELIALLPRLRRYAYGLTGTPHDADDLLQSTVERVLAKGPPDAVDVDKWAFRICRNAWIDEIRARKVRSPVALEDMGELEDVIDGERVVLGKLAVREIRTAMDALPDDQRAALTLVVLEGYSYAEAASILETPIGTIMSRIARARVALGNALRGDLISATARVNTGART
jgi:RNA polymerase sigma factor (sigma-70 family)